MRQWVLALFALVAVGCEGTSEQDPSVIHKLCMDACAHIHAKNCIEKPAVDVQSCDAECINASSFSSTPCTDEQAALYACTAKAEIACPSIPGSQPRALGCEAEEQEVTKCGSPGLGCVRSEGSDITCFDFGFKRFFVCSEGIGPDPMCIQVASNGFCCP